MLVDRHPGYYRGNPDAAVTAASNFFNGLVTLFHTRHLGLFRPNTKG